ncbi:hypothetical protein BD309DRAFT_743550 [Dichomitus squalens]|nr:hypothetical protein BD309DRAFT_743550 [Dichomitus squalens]
MTSSVASAIGRRAWTARRHSSSVTVPINGFTLCRSLHGALAATEGVECGRGAICRFECSSTPLTTAIRRGDCSDTST